MKNKAINIFNFLRKGNDVKSPKIKDTYYIGNYSTFNKSWKDSGYHNLAKEGFMNNVIVNRAVSMIAKNASSIDLLFYEIQGENRGKVELSDQDDIVRLLNRPNKKLGKVLFIEYLLLYFLICGNAYIYAQINEDGSLDSLELLRPDRVKIEPDNFGESIIYEYAIDEKTYNIRVSENDKKSALLHIKNFHPLDDYYGFSNLESAKDIVEQYNECVKWNRSLVKNGARPSGAIIVKNENGTGGSLTDEQFEQIRSQLQNYSGEDNAGRMLILEGGLDWREMSVSPRDMEFLETKNGAARDIALSLGVPPQLLGIKGDNTYNNVAEARLAFWEETVLPLLNGTLNEISCWLSRLVDREILISYDKDTISALSSKRSEIWNSMKNSDFITTSEKREMLGFESVENEKNSNTQKNRFSDND